MDRSAQSPAKTLKTAYILAVAVTAVALAGMRLYVISTGKFSTAFAVAAVLLVLGCGVFSFFLGRQTGQGLRHGTPSLAFGNGIVGFLFVTMVVASFIVSHPKSENIVIYIIMTVFAVLSAVYFLLSAASGAFFRKAGLFSVFSLAVPLYFGFQTLNDFINSSFLPFGNSGAYHILSLLFAMLFFLFESRQTTGRGIPFLYLTFGGGAALLLTTYNVPVLVQYLRGLDVNGYEAVKAILAVAVCVYILLRVASAPGTAPKTDGTPETADPPEETAEEDGGSPV